MRICRLSGLHVKVMRAMTAVIISISSTVACQTRQLHRDSATGIMMYQARKEINISLVRLPAFCLVEENGFVSLNSNKPFN
jgi:hypothetical protein